MYFGKNTNDKNKSNIIYKMGAIFKSPRCSQNSLFIYHIIVTGTIMKIKKINNSSMPQILLGIIIK